MKNIEHEVYRLLTKHEKEFGAIGTIEFLEHLLEIYRDLEDRQSIAKEGR